MFFLKKSKDGLAIAYRVVAAAAGLDDLVTLESCSGQIRPTTRPNI